MGVLMEYAVLDKGLLRLVDMLGGDEAVVQAARVSFGKGSKGEAKDKLLIDYLMQHGHHTPFEHAVFKFHVKCPIFVARQWFRHRWSSFNEISGRYTEMKDEFYVPEHWRTQKDLNYQYANLPEETGGPLSARLGEMFEHVYALYEDFIARGVAKEQARIILPLSLYTQFYWTVNTRSLINFLMLRLDEHAQYEIRMYAEKINEVFEAKMPWSYEAFMKHMMPRK
jgi:thymidylate synthase (FAD)